MFDTANSSSGRHAINRRVFDYQRKGRSQGQLAAVDDVDGDTDRPFSRADVRLEVQKWWWQL